MNPSDLLKFADNLIDHLRIFNKQHLDDIWLNLISCILKNHAGQHHIEVALELSDPNNNESTNRVAASMLVALAQKV